ncbi:MAG: hypothetical protein ACREPZ_04030, partial [Rhodanobacteraceae bacterium]
MSRARNIAGVFHRRGRRVVVGAAVLVAAMCAAPAALAHSHVGFGISIGVGNCWRCGYRAAPPVYYAPAYPPPAYYYPPTVYYAPPAYYGYTYGYAPYHHYRRYRHYDHRGHYPRDRGH